MPSPSIAVHVSSLKIDPAHTFGDEHYWRAYRDLLLQLQALGVDAYFVTDGCGYRGNGLFERAYTMTRPGRPEELQEHQLVPMDLIYDRAGFGGTGVAVVNPPGLSAQINCKAWVNSAFAHLQPLTSLHHDLPQLAASLRDSESERVVVKVPGGEGGEGVEIGHPDEVLQRVRDWSFPLLAQEFIDTSVGIPGLVEGVHDLRVIVIGGEIAGGTIRQPAPGELRANRKLGGSVTYLQRADIPAEFIDLVTGVDARFAGQPRHYAADCGNTATGPKLFELNSWPGLAPASFSPISAGVLEVLSSYLVQLAHQAAEAMTSIYASPLAVS